MHQLQLDAQQMPPRQRALETQQPNARQISVGQQTQVYATKHVYQDSRLMQQLQLDAQQMPPRQYALVKQKPNAQTTNVG